MSNCSLTKNCIKKGENLKSRAMLQAYLSNVVAYSNLSAEQNEEELFVIAYCMCERVREKKGIKNVTHACYKYMFI